MKYRVLLAVAIAAICNALFGGTVTIDGITWEYLDSARTTLVSVKNASGAVVIPSGYTSIYSDAFKDCPNITSVTIPKSMTEVRGISFVGCNKLTSLLVESGHPSLVSVDGILYNKALDRIVCCPPGKSGWMTITNGVKYINSYAFYGCNITSVEIPSGVIQIGDQAFEKCQYLLGITVDVQNTKYSSYDYALYDKDQKTLICCPAGMTSITLPATVTSVGYCPFDACDRLSWINVHAENKNYSSFDGILYDRNRTQLIRCPPGKPGQINVLEGVTRIDTYGFYNCNTITKIYLPSTLSAVSTTSFCGCRSLTAIEVAASNPKYYSRNGMLCCANYVWDDWSETSHQEGDMLLCCPGGLVSVTIPDTVYYIWEYAFRGNKIKYLSIPDSVNDIYSSAFVQSDLETLLIPDSVKWIGSSAFSSCKNLKSVIFKGGTTVGEKSFGGCSSLAAIVSEGDALVHGDYFDSDWDWCGDGMPSFLYGANPNCVLIKKPGSHPWGDGDNYYSILTEEKDWEGVRVIKSTLDAYPSGSVYCDRIDDVVVYYTTDQTQNAAICGAVRISSAGETCDSITIPNKLGNCDVTEISASAFENFTWLREIVVPTTITSIGRGAFSGCSSLSTMISPVGNSDRIKQLLSQSGVTVDGLTFKEYQEIAGTTWEYAIVDGGVRVLGAENVAVELDVPTQLGGKAVVAIAEGAFRDKDNIKKVVIPSTVCEIGDDAFAGCGNLTSITFNGNAPTMSTRIFRSVPTSCVIYVRKASTGWMVEIPGYLNDLPIQYQEDAIFVETKDGIQWMSQFGGRLVLSSERTVGESLSGRVELPSTINGQQIVSVGSGLLRGAVAVTEVVIPSTVRVIEASAFERCTELRSVEIPEGVVSIGDNAFRECVSLQSITIPSTVTNIGCFAFKDCRQLECIDPTAYTGIAKIGAFETQPIGGISNAEYSYLTVTNIMVNYIAHSVQPEFVIPATYDTGFVNVIAEVKGGCVAIPATWTVNYPKFTEKFGSDFTKALSMKSGKLAAGGREMLVWEDYVAGTDPTDPNDKFTATMTIVGGKPVISYTPELDDARKALRTYTTYGKAKLTDAEWTVVPVGEEAKYNFFKVTVEMK